MNLRTDRRHVDSDISFFMNSTATRGGIVSLNGTGSSGVAMDQAESTVAYAAEPSGIEPVGLLINDVVNLDLTRQHINFHKDEVQVGGKVTVWTDCTVVTDFVYPDHTPTPGQTAYVCDSGYIGNADISTDAGQSTNGVGVSSTRIVGRFLTGKDEDGYAKVSIKLPS